MKSYLNRFAIICEDTYLKINKNLSKPEKPKALTAILDVFACQKILELEF
jgi:hypothetical protein